MPTNPVKARVERKGHFIKNRRTEIILGFIVFTVGCILLWDAFDGRNKKMPFPMSGLAPW